MTRDHQDDLFDTESLEFEFDARPEREPVSETVELSRSALAPRAPARRLRARSLALLVGGAVAVGLISFGIVSAVRGDGSTAASPPAQTAPPSTSVATTAQGTTAPATTAASPATGAELVPVAPGDEGEDVRRLQEALATLGFDPGEADGVYGDATVAAVAAFQASVGLAEDGIAGPETTAALNEALARG